MLYGEVVQQMRNSAKTREFKIVVPAKELIVIYARFGKARCVIRAVEGTQNSCVRVYLNGIDLGNPLQLFVSHCMYSADPAETLDGWRTKTRFDRFDPCPLTLEQLVMSGKA